jgi:signal transduction histidine kinase
VTALRLDVEAVDDPVVAERLQEHVEHLQLAIDAVVRAARRPVRSTMHHTCDATATVRERTDFWSPLAEDQGRRFECRLPGEPVEVSVEAADLRDIVDILVDNVFAHTPESTPFEVSLTRGPRPLLTVRDHGPGMADTPGSVDHAPQRQGFSGLGLQIVRRTVARFNGEMTTTSSPGEGTRIQVWLPPAPPGENGSPHRRGIGRGRRSAAERRGRSS